MTTRVRPAHLLALLAALILVGSLSVGAEAATPRRARATIDVGGTAIDIDIRLLSCMPKQITGPVAIDVVVPAGQTGTVLDLDNGFRGQGYAVGFSEGVETSMAHVTVTVPAKSAICRLDIGYAHVDPTEGPAMAGPARTNRPITFDIFV